MAKELHAPPLAKFFKFREIGEATAGKVSRVSMTDNGPILTFAPFAVKIEGKWFAWGDGAVGLSTDLKVKLTNPATKVGKFLYFDFKDTEPTKKGSKRKIFRVMELSAQEYANIVAKAGANVTSDPYPGASEAEAEDIDATEPETDDTLDL